MRHTVLEIQRKKAWKRERSDDRVYLAIGRHFLLVNVQINIHPQMLQSVFSKATAGSDRNSPLLF